MATIVWTQSDIDTLKAAIAKGVLAVTYTNSGNGTARSVTYQSLAEMRSLLAEMVGQVSGRTTYRRVGFKKGF